MKLILGAGQESIWKTKLTIFKQTAKILETCIEARVNLGEIMILETSTEILICHKIVTAM
jgi:hypothetical protein